MGLFDTLKNIAGHKNFEKNLNESIDEAAKEFDEFDESEERHAKMTLKELSELSDDELLEAVEDRAEKNMDDFETWEDWFNSLNPSQKAVYSVACFEEEAEDGGLCSFFINFSQAAPFISDYMSTIGANEHKKLFDDFISKSGIDLSDPSLFKNKNTKKLEKQLKGCPIDEYDSAFAELEPLKTFLVRYTKEHLADF